MEKYLYTKALPHIYKLRKGIVSTVTVPTQKIIFIEGCGFMAEDKNFFNAVKVLYMMANQIKNECRKLQQRDFKIFPMDSAWWQDDPTSDLFDPANRKNWKWKISIPIPDFIIDETWESTTKLYDEKRKMDSLFNSVGKLEIQTRPEQLVAQALHFGSLEEQAPVIEMIKSLATQNGYLIGGGHHEVYLKNLAKTYFKNLQTIIRYPIKVIDDPIYRREMIKMLSLQNGIPAIEIAKRMNLKVEEVLSILLDVDLLSGTYIFRI